MDDFDFKKRWLTNNCPYGVEYFCDGSVNKSIEGYKVRIPIKRCPQRKNGRCNLLAQVVQNKQDND